MLKAVVIISPVFPPSASSSGSSNAHYDERFGRGFEYAYVIPGVTRVVQAAGRLIRSDLDRGVIALMDQRFLQQAPICAISQPNGSPRRGLRDWSVSPRPSPRSFFASESFELRRKGLVPCLGRSLREPPGRLLHPSLELLEVLFDEPMYPDPLQLRRENENLIRLQRMVLVDDLEHPLQSILELGGRNRDPPRSPLCAGLGGLVHLQWIVVVKEGSHGLSRGQSKAFFVAPHVDRFPGTVAGNKAGSRCTSQGLFRPAS